MRLLEGGDVEPRGRAADLDEVTQDAIDLQGIGDDGEDFHLAAAVRADEGVFCIDF